ncbi:Gem-associated protein 2 [Macleaya cordata]|uniref:Gem-associated protein 2 n=1 Tax=Macleaya cordata TaxID=56857 RepID=A0A200R107_MACCD|nr:Gem-associated protein 2 [Macleaya cordata]
MGRNLSPILRRELANLDKDADSRKSAMKALKSYVKDLDSKAIPQFLAQVSETKDPGSTAGEHTISLYEVLARVHGSNIVPQIDNIMSTIIKTLTSSAGSFPLQQACSKVVPAIARYAIDPSTPEDKKRKIIRSLCKPLSDSLLGSQESLAFGAALCLKALVDSDNWRFAPDEVVNEVCLRVAGALEEKPTQSNSHMSLAMSLGKHNSLTLEAYARSLIRSGLRILNVGAAEGNSQKRLSAIQMVNFLMKCVDPRSISSELGSVMEEMEKCNSDQMAFVKGAAFEALQTAKLIASEKGSKFEDPGSATGSNFHRRRDYNRRKNSWGGRDRSPVSAVSPESQTVYSFVEYDSFAESPMSTGQSSSNFDYRGRSVNRKLWRNENDRVDVSLKDGLYSNGFSSNGFKSYSEHFEDGKISDDGDHSEIFSGFVHATPRNGVTLSATPSPQRGYDQCNIDDIRIFTTPRKLIRSLQDPVNANSDYSSAKPVRRIRSPASGRSGWSPTWKLDANSLNDDSNGNENSEAGKQASDGSESVSSTCDAATDANTEVSHEVGPECKTTIGSISTKRESFARVVLKFLCSVLFFILFAIMLSMMSTDNQELSLVPT